jgi:peptide/nickel transport system permease protein
MRTYVLLRLGWTVLATWLLLTVAFGLLIPAQYERADTAAAQAAASGQDPETARQAYLESRGLDRPLHVQYADFVTDLVTLDWGTSQSLRQGVPITDIIADAWPHSAQYVIPGTILSALLGYGIGLYTAMHQHEWSDYVGSFVAYFGISVPNFYFAIVLILLFGVWAKSATILGVDLSAVSTPVYYDPDVGTLALANLRQLILPIVVVSTAGVAGQMRYSRAQALEYVNADFVKLARAKGAGDRRVLLRHVFRVALVPLSTILVADVLALIFAGSFIVESIFQINGLGLIGLKAIRAGDTRLVLSTILIPTFIAVIGNLLQDLAYVALDPRIDYGDRT